MKSIIKRKDKLVSIFLLVTSTLFAILFLIFPEYFKESEKNAVYICLNSVIPSLFCYIVLSKIIVSSGALYLVAKIFGKPFNKLSGLSPNAAGIYLLSFIAGYPTGAVAACELYSRGEATKKDAERLIAVCNNTGPALPVLILGIGVLNNPLDGFVLFFIQLLSTILCTALYRKKSAALEWQYNAKFDGTVIGTITKSVNGAIRATALLCAYVIIFSTVLTAVNLIPSPINPISKLFPFFEIVSGSLLLSDNRFTKFIILAGALSFGGLCVHMQTAALASPLGLSLKEHFKYKLSEALISMVLAALCLSFEFMMV